MRIFEEIYKNADMGVVAIDGVLDHLENEQFRNELNCQREGLLQVRTRAAEQLDVDAVKRSQASFVEKGMLKSGIALKAMSDKTGECVAEMMIEGTNMGINSLQKEINKLNAKGEQVPELATELCTQYQNNLNQIRHYL